MILNLPQFLSWLFSEDYDQVVKTELMCLFLKMLCWQLSLEKINSGRDNIREKLGVWNLSQSSRGGHPDHRNSDCYNILIKLESQRKGPFITFLCFVLLCFWK